MAEAVANEGRAKRADDLLDELKAEIGAEGFQHLLDDAHSVSYVARGPKLLVTFERVQDTLESSEWGLPLGLDFAEDKNWSVLHFAADGNTWFRSEAVYRFLDEMVDDAFFEDFDQVTFFGANMGAYAAAAFSVVAPGARVVTICPQATLSSEQAEWDSRFPVARRLDFDSRYAYAPDMVEAASEVFVLYDPHEVMDAVHASLFRSDNVTRLKCRFFQAEVSQILLQMDLLHQIIEEAADGRLAPQRFYQLLRRRRGEDRYLRNLMFHLDDVQRPYLTLLLCTHVLSHKSAPAFLRRLKAARATLAERGQLPDWSMPD